MTTITVDLSLHGIPEHVYSEAFMQGFNRLAYKYGMTEPHYPVPATQRNGIIASSVACYLGVIPLWRQS